jgi:hypothetical protein
MSFLLGHYDGAVDVGLLCLFRSANQEQNDD